ncbi:cupin [Rhodococcus sp. Leaf7]|uniref:cupin domain-containing protein n=1 Tax=unclassified Rhodococcus (in: high G+C Gram-positive bacteria) TaxID=192944 RepID=UPI0006F39646|nr:MULTISPECIES: cupin domain-containing protein [unclassified Rhodococcus (in: high G+C Gram-positive bacteria)]KQU07763.1 cupin [Rhodococcus sp. Leaf7]KQU43280.1 cupin [Rhodococcus sp. Leaf247]
MSIEARTFADEHWGIAPLLTRREDLSSTFEDLLSVDAVDELVSERGVRTPFARMAKNGSLTARENFTDSGGFGAEVTDQLDSAGILAAFADGHTLVLQGLHRLWPPLIHFAGELVRDLGHPVQVNSYITPASSRGFDPHYDVHDVFVLQISGEKRWILHPPVHQHPLSHQPWSDRKDDVAAMARTTPTIDTVLREGDSLYVPRGWIHSAQALGDTSIHLTVGMSAFTRYDLLHHLVSTFAEDARFRSPLPVGIDLTDADAVAPHVRALLTDLVSALDENDAPVNREHAVADRVGRRFTEVTRPAPVRPLATIGSMAALSANSVVGWRPGLHARIVDADDAVTVTTRTKSVRLPAVCASAVHQLHSGKDCVVGELSGLDTDDALVVVRRLLREGIVVPRSSPVPPTD